MIKSSITKKNVISKSEVISKAEANESIINSALKIEPKKVMVEEKTKFDILIEHFEKAISDGNKVIVKGANPELKKEEERKTFFIVVGKDGKKFICSDYKERKEDLFLEGLTTYKQSIKSLKREYNILEDWEIDEIK